MTRQLLTHKVEKESQSIQLFAQVRSQDFGVGDYLIVRGRARRSGGPKSPAGSRAELLHGGGLVAKPQPLNKKLHFACTFAQ
jgi:hypothetical protein